MGLKEEIKEEYCEFTKYQNKVSEKYLKKFFSTNQPEVFKKIMTLEKPLLSFADKFDEYLDYMCKNKNGELPEGMYECIKKSFVDKIAEIDKDFFIYVAKKGEQWKDAKRSGIYSRNIKKFLDIFENFKSEFLKSEKLTELRVLIMLFERTEDNFDDDFYKFKKLDDYRCSEKHFKYIINHEYYFNLCNYLNACTISFIKNIIYYTLEELYNKKELINSTRECITGSDEKYFHDKSGKGFEYGHTIKPAPKDVKIFPAGKPLPYEVEQADIGDCYLMAALISLAKINPKAIEACFTQGLDKIENEDNIKIRFFYKVRGGYGFTKKSLEIVVNKKTIIERSGTKDRALWPNLMEKAYAIYRNEGYDFTSTLSKKLGGGHSDTVMFAITGEKIDCIKSEFAEFETTDRKNRRRITSKPGYVIRSQWVKTGDERLPGLMEIKFKRNIINTIIEKLKEKKAVTCSFKKDFKIKDKKSKEKIKIITDHEYAIVGVNDEERYVRLVNPWKSDGRTKTDKPLGLREGGHIAMPYDDFREYCLDISTSSDSPISV